MRISIHRGDITKVPADVIVNAANRKMLGGGGVDGAIHRAAGPDLARACFAYPEIRPGIRVEVGDVRATPAFNLPAQWVFHTVGPIYDSNEDRSALLRSCYGNCLWLAERLNARVISFPAISCGVYKYPFDEAAEIAIETCRSRSWQIDEAKFILFEQATYDAWEEALNGSGKLPAFVMSNLVAVPASSSPTPTGSPITTQDLDDILSMLDAGKPNKP